MGLLDLDRVEEKWGESSNYKLKKYAKPRAYSKMKMRF